MLYLSSCCHSSTSHHSGLHPCAVEMSEQHNESEETPSDMQLKTKLQDHGLDPEYWLKELINIGITNIHALQYIQAEDCSSLENKIQYGWERRALRKLFGIPDSSEKIAKVQEKQAEILKNRNELASEMLTDLKLFKSERKSLQDKDVSRKMEEMQKLLEIPSERSVPFDKTLGELVDYLEKQHILRVEACSSTNHFTEEEVIKISSGGLVLEGIFHTNNKEELCKKRETLLCVPEDFRLLGPEQGSYFGKIEFTSHEEETNFRKTFEKVGLSFSTSFGFGFKQFGRGCDDDYSKSSSSEVTTNSSEDRTYICITKYNYVPLASYYFNMTQLRLSQDALSELKEIEKLICMDPDTKILRNKCDNFFKRFGSHANLGPIHFGGIFWWKASMEGVHKNDIHEVKTSISQALDFLMNFSYEGIKGNVDMSSTNTYGSAEKSKITEYMKQIQVSVTKTGGPLDADDLPVWKAGLVTSNKSWSVIDRGFQFVPIWKIILENHKNEFKDAAKLSSCLMESYKYLSGLNAEGMVEEKLQVKFDETQHFLEGVKSWDLGNAKKHLNDLLDFKQKYNELTKSHSTWVNVCLTDKNLQTFLVKVAEKYKEDSSYDTDIIKAKMQKLVEPYIYSTKDFPDASVLIKWIYDSKKDELDHIEIREFTELSDVLKKSIADILHVTVGLKSSIEEVHQTKIRATLNISLSLYSFLRLMRETGQTDMELLILCIANNSGYCVENHNFRTLLGHKEIEFLKDQLLEAYIDYTNLRKQCAQWAQAFVLYIGLTSVGQYHELPSQQKTERLNFMIKHLRGSLSPDVHNILNQNSGNWEIVESNLRAFSNGCTVHEEVQAQDLVEQISYLCQEEKTSTENSDIADISNITGDFSLLLKDLVLENYYPQKMKTSDFHTISRAALSGARPSENKELPIYFLQKLLVLDYSARYVHCENKSEESNTINFSDINDTSDDCLQDFFGTNKESAEEQNAQQPKGIHPMDIQMAIFHCADDFMRQNIYTKLSFCQFALPLLVPNPNTRSIEFPLWAFQQVKKKWKMQHGDDTEKSKLNEKFVKDIDTPIVSFIRLGPSVFSKSQTINWLMSKQRHNIFYHRNCEGSTKSSILMDGVAEIAWYCPGGKEDDAFDDCTAFVNLHGDARDHSPQLEFIQEISSVIVIVLTDSDLKDSKSASLIRQLLVSTKPCAFLLVDKEFDKSEYPHKLKIGIKGKNEAELIKKIRTKIQELLLMKKEVYSLNNCAAPARRLGFLVDEDKEQCKVGKEQAEILLNLLKTKEIPAMKNEILPLQGDLWRQWCRKDKELNRLGGKSFLSIEQQRSNIESKKEALRREQLKKVNPLNKFMEYFLQFLHSNEQGSKMYFLQWFKMYLDELSSEALSGLNHKYYFLWSSVNKEKGAKRKTAIETTENKLQELSNNINISTFGLEHVLRELGQIYESLEAQDQIISNLPKIAANLMVWGYPIELMDGDTAHVPHKWITAILHELKNKLGDKKLFVLSVLGIQSTGKSTLLNAMFGLQFAVSAGRCTRGAFMQLVKVEEKLCNERTYDYVLVIDTEGLRSVRLSSQNRISHDNELATFVIGLGNLTLINIFGENPAEMQDILQIVVQAFLRMKKVNLHPRCLFVHQNVGEITAKEKNMDARRCLLSKLDEMTLCAAKQEECEETCFNDVIQFDVETHSHYFAHLWEGDPPMAPPNPRYSQNVQALRKVILEFRKEKDNILSISAFRARVTDLWNALLNENFVFSFKNSLEIVAYNKLEVKYSEWAWRLRESMLRLQNEINNQSRKEEIKSIDGMLINDKFNDVYKTVQDDIKVFFKEAKDKHILVQWKANTEYRIASLKDELIQEIKTKANELILLKEKNRKIDRMKAKYEDELFAKSKEVAQELKGQNLNDEDLKAKFKTLWEGWILAVKEDMPDPEVPNIFRDLEEILREHFQKEANITSTIRESEKWVDLTHDFHKFVSSKRKCYVWKESLSDENKTKIYHSINVLDRQIDEYILKKQQEKMDYLSSYFHEILKTIQGEVYSMFDKKFKFLTDFILYASLFLCRKAAGKFSILADDYRKANDPVVYLESKREEFYTTFKVFCEGKLEARSLADIISIKLKVSFQQAVYEKSAINVSSDMKRNHKALNGNRSKVELGLLMSLAQKENFQNYLTYFTDPKLSMKEFIKECIEDYMRDTRKMSGLLHDNVDAFKKITVNAINLSTEKIKKEKGNVDSWLEVFCSELGNELNLSCEDLKRVKYQNLTEIDSLQEAMTQAVDNVVQTCKEELSTCNMTSLQERILRILTDNFSMCWEQCPFCGAVCTNTIPQHNTRHNLKFHRPTGLNGRTSWLFGHRLRTDICTSLVSSTAFFLSNDKRLPFFYKNYTKAGERFSKWSITPDNSSLSYWKWVSCTFQSDIEKWQGYKFERIPAQWKHFRKADVISEIEKLLSSN